MQTSQPTTKQLTPGEVVRELSRFLGCQVRLRFAYSGLETSHDRIVVEGIALDEMAFFEDHAYALRFDDPEIAVTVDCARVTAMKWSFLLRPALTLELESGRLVLIDLTDSGRVRAIEHSVGSALAAEVSVTQRSWRLGSCLRTVNHALGEIEAADSRVRLEGLREFLAPYKGACPPDPPLSGEIPF